MKLRIEEIFWGINRNNGKKIETITADVTFPCEVGKIPEFGKGNRKFFIDEVTEKGIVLSVRYEKNLSANKKWNIEVNTEVAYIPRSFDGGYKYRFYVTE